MNWKDIQISNKLIIVFLAIGLIAVIALGLISFNQSKESLIASSTSQLIAVRDIKKNQVNDFFEERLADIRVYSFNTAIQMAAERFINAFEEEGLQGDQYQEWETLHGSKLETYVSEYHYYDLFFISNKGDVVYTVAKESDLGKNLLKGSLSNSSLAEAFNKGMNDYSLIDFSWYEVSEEPAAFVSGPIEKANGERIGVLVYQLSLEAINDIMQERSGMGETGETYLVGPDKLMRSDSYLDPQGHSVKASFKGTVAENGVSTEAVNEALAGKTDAKIIIDYNGNPVFSAYTPVKFGETTWAMMAEIDEAEVMAPVNALGRQIVIVAILVALVIIVVSIVFARSIAKPIHKGVEFAKKLSQGDLTAEIDVNQKDEIGVLADALKGMLMKLKDIVVNIRGNAENIAAASMQMSSSSQEMSQGATEQASSAEEVSSSMEEMVSNIQQNTDNSQQTEKIAIKSSEGVQEGNKSSEISVQAMKDIAEKITIINDIAFQTNILALNAAVEAARAGEHGKGFAVVASEVRNLAERSKVAADEIDQLSKNGVDVSERAGKQLAGIVPEIERTAKLVQEISAASIEQNSGADQINNAIQQLNQVTQQNAAASEEMATSSEELASQAEQLKELMAFFKIDQAATARQEEIAKQFEQATKTAVEKTKAQNGGPRNLKQYKRPAQQDPVEKEKGSGKGEKGATIKLGERDNDYENF